MKRTTTKVVRGRVGIALRIIAVMFAGCAQGGIAGVESMGDAEVPLPDAGNAAVPLDASIVTTPVPQIGCDAIDIVFVIDDSSSMAEEQANLVASFPSFITALDALTTSDGAPVDYRVAVTTTTVNQISSSVAPDGRFAQHPECGLAQPWLERGEPDAAFKFGCLARVGTVGGGNESPLAAAALAADAATNIGFRRDSALIAIVVITDEDDQSYGLFPQTYLFSQRMDQLAGARDRWALAVIAAPEPCTSAFGAAPIAATRLMQVVNWAGNNAVFHSLCEGDLALPLTGAFGSFGAACEEFPPLI